MAQKGGAAFTIVFGLIFLSIGVGVGYFSARTLVRAEAMRSWQATPAKVVSCELSVSRGSKGGSSYQAKATYQYEVGGVRHTCDRVSLYSGSDNIGRFQQRAYSDLKQCMDRKRATTCWVNPQNAGDAVLIRKLRPEMLIFMQLFALTFGGVGLGIVLTGLAALLQPAASADASAGQGHIRMRGASAHRVAGALALVWNGYVGWFLWKAYHVMAPDAVPWYLWLFAATGVIPAAAAGYLIGRFRKFGVSVFEMSPLPGVLGGPVSGTVRIPAKVETEAGFELVLQCIHQYTAQSGKNSTTRRDVLWEDARHIDGSLSYGEETMLPVSFAAPYEKPATTVAGGSNGYYWRLNVTAAAPGIDYKAVFDVPVQRTPQSVATPVPQQMQFQAAGQERAADAVARMSLRLEPLPGGGFELVFPAARALASSLFLALFAAGWSGMCYVLWAVVKAPVFFALIFTFFDLVLVIILVNALMVSKGIVVDRALRECVVWWRAPGLSKRERRIPFDAVTDIRSERSAQSGNTVYYRVVLTTNEGSPVTVGSGMKMWSDAESVAKLVLAAMKPDFNLEAYRG